MTIRKLAISLFLVVMTVNLTGCFYRTGPTEVGVRVKKFSLGKRGVENKVYGPGSIYIFMPLINDWYTLDTKLQNVSMSFNKEGGDRKSRDDLLFKTIDGNDIGLDVIISYRLDPFIKMKTPDGREILAGPYIIQYVAKSDIALKEKIVRTITRSKSRDVFSTLKTEQFYVARDRDTKSNTAVEVLNEILSGFGITVERVGTGDYRFNPLYAQAIEEKIKADAEVEKLKSEREEKTREFEIRVAEKQAEVNQRIAFINGQFEQAKMMADAYFEKQKQIAEAIIKEGEAKAKGIEKKRLALSGPGGNTFVRLEMARALKNKKITLIPTGGVGGAINLIKTDVNDLLSLQGLDSLAGQKPQTTTETK